MGKYDAYSREQLKIRRRAWRRRNRRGVAVLVAGIAVGVGASIALLAASSPTPAVLYLTGAANGAALALIPFFLTFAHLAHDREAVGHLRGAWGEENTRDILRSARRRRLILGSVDSIRLQAGDLDHVVVTKGGEVVVIDSKWRSDSATLSPQAMADSAARAARRTEGILRSNLRSERGSHRARGIATPVTPLVVVWGAAQATLPPSARIGNVEFVAGSGLREWLAARDGQGKRREGRDLLARLEAFRETASSGRAAAR